MRRWITLITFFILLTASSQAAEFNMQIAAPDNAIPGEQVPVHAMTTFGNISVLSIQTTFNLTMPDGQTKTIPLSNEGDGTYVGSAYVPWEGTYVINVSSQRNNETYSAKQLLTVKKPALAAEITLNGTHIQVKGDKRHTYEVNVVYPTPGSWEDQTAITTCSFTCASCTQACQVGSALAWIKVDNGFRNDILKAVQELPPVVADGSYHETSSAMFYSDNVLNRLLESTSLDQEGVLIYENDGVISTQDVKPADKTTTIAVNQGYDPGNGTWYVWAHAPATAIIPQDLTAELIAAYDLETGTQLRHTASTIYARGPFEAQTNQVRQPPTLPSNQTSRYASAYQGTWNVPIRFTNAQDSVAYITPYTNPNNTHIQIYDSGVYYARENHILINATADETFQGSKPDAYTLHANGQPIQLNAQPEDTHMILLDAQASVVVKQPIDEEKDGNMFTPQLPQGEYYLLLVSSDTRRVAPLHIIDEEATLITTPEQTIEAGLDEEITYQRSITTSKRHKAQTIDIKIDSSFSIELTDQSGNALRDTNLDGIPDTGPLAPGTTLVIRARGNIPKQIEKNTINWTLKTPTYSKSVTDTLRIKDTSDQDMQRIQQADTGIAHLYASGKELTVQLYNDDTKPRAVRLSITSDKEHTVIHNTTTPPGLHNRTITLSQPADTIFVKILEDDDNNKNNVRTLRTKATPGYQFRVVEHEGEDHEKYAVKVTAPSGDWSVTYPGENNTIKYADTMRLSGTELLVRLPVPANTEFIATLTPGQPATHIPYHTVDNRDNQARLLGTWHSSYQIAGYFGTDYMHDLNSGKGSKEFMYAPPTHGWYEVEMWYPADPALASNSQVHIGKAIMLLNQRVFEGWKYLGRHHFSQGQTVTLSNLATNGIVIADAVRFLRVDQYAKTIWAGDKGEAESSESIGEDLEPSAHASQGPARVGKPVRWNRLVSANQTVIEIPAQTLDVQISEKGRTQRGLKVRFANGSAEDLGVHLAQNNKREAERLKQYTRIKPAGRGLEKAQNITVRVDNVSARTSLLEVEYYTEAPLMVREPTAKGKEQITITSQTHYVNITASMNLSTPVPKEGIQLIRTTEGIQEEVKNITYADHDGDGLIDEIEWVVPHLSDQTYELDITILNPVEYLRDGETWTVLFTTEGEGTLTIDTNNSAWQELPIDDPYTADEMEFLDITCDNVSLTNRLQVRDENLTWHAYSTNSSLKPTAWRIENYSCAETGTFSNLMHIAGYAELRFTFSDGVQTDVAYALDPVPVGLNSTGFDATVYLYDTLGNANHSDDILVASKNISAQTADGLKKDLGLLANGVYSYSTYRVEIQISTNVSYDLDADYHGETVIVGTGIFTTSNATNDPEYVLTTSHVSDTGLHGHDVFVSTTQNSDYTNGSEAFEAGFIRGDPDLVVGIDGNGPATTVQMLTNDGTPFDASWIAADIYDSGNSDIFAVNMVDIDLDGDMDIIIGSEADEVRGCRNDGTATFDCSFVFDPNTQREVYGVEAADFDNDGDIDVIFSNSAGQDIYLLENDGDPWQNSWSRVTVSQNIGGSGYDIAVADYDKDGYPDIVSKIQQQGRVYHKENDQTPFTGSWPAETIIFTASHQVFSAIVGDFDRDGYSDVAIGDLTNEVHVLRNNGTQATTWEEQLAIGTAGAGGTGVRELRVGDIDNDQWPDIITTNTMGGDITWLRNNGTPFNGNWIQTAIGTNVGGTVEAVAVADFNANGYLDVAWGSYSNFAQIAENNGTGGGWANVSTDVSDDIMSIDAQDLDMDARSNILDFFSNKTDNIEQGIASTSFSGWDTMSANTNYSFSFILSPDDDFAQGTKDNFTLMLGEESMQGRTRIYERLWGADVIPIKASFSWKVNNPKYIDIDQITLSMNTLEVSINPLFPDEYITAKCHARNNETLQDKSEPYNYSIGFYLNGTMLATNITNSTGWAEHTFQSDNVGTNVPVTCAPIEDLAHFDYAAQNATAYLNITDTTPPMYNGVGFSFANTSNLTRNQTEYAWINLTDNYYLNHSYREHNATGTDTNYTLALNTSSHTQYANHTLNFLNMTEFPLRGPVTISSLGGVDRFGNANASMVNQEFNLYSYSNVSIWTNPPLVDDFGDNGTVLCRVQDVFAQENVSGYEVNVSDNVNGYRGTYITDANGLINVSINVTQALAITCAIGDQHSLYLYADQDAKESTAIYTADITPGVVAQITNPTSPYEATHSRTFGMNASVLCVNGDCNDVNATLVRPDNGWWSFDYGYRRRLNITTGANTPYNDYDGYTVRAVMDTTGPRFLDNGDDIRVIYNDSGTFRELDRIVVNENTTSTQVRFKLFADINASTSTQEYWIYHGNRLAAVPPEEPLNVYLWYDDASVDRQGDYTQGRIDSSAHGGAWNNGVAHDGSSDTYLSDTDDNFADSLRPTGLTERDVYVEIEHYHVNAYPIDMTSGPLTRWVGTGSGGTEDSSHFYYYEIADSTTEGGGYASHDDITADSRGNVVVANGLLGTLAPGSWNRIGLATWGVNPTNLRAYYNNESGGWGGSRFSGTHASLSDNEQAGEVGWWQQQDNASLDNVLIRRYTEPEPTVAVATQQSIGQVYALTNVSGATPLSIVGSHPHTHADTPCLEGMLKDGSCSLMISVNATGDVPSTHQVYLFAESNNSNDLSEVLTVNIADNLVPKYTNWQLSVINGSIVYRNESLFATANWTDDWSLNRSILEHAGSGTPTNYTQSLDGTAALANHTLNLSSLAEWATRGPHSITTMYGIDDYDNMNSTTPALSFILYSYASVNITAIPGAVAQYGDESDVTCGVSDFLTGTSIANYAINVSDNVSGYRGTYFTNASGEITVPINVSEHINVTCTIGDNATQYLTAHPDLNVAWYDLNRDTEPPRWSAWSVRYEGNNSELVNGTNLTRSDTLYAQAQWTDNFRLGSAKVEHNGSGSVANYTVPGFPSPAGANESHANYTLDFSQSTEWGVPGPILVQTMHGLDLAPNVNETAPPYWFTLYGTLETSITITNPNNVLTTDIEIECRVSDTVTTAGVQGYLVNLTSSDTGFIGSTLTNSNGIAAFNYTDSTHGQETITCSIVDIADDYYYIDQFNDSATIFLGSDPLEGAYNVYVRVWDTMGNSDPADDVLLVTDYLLNAELESGQARLGMIDPYEALYNYTDYVIEILLEPGSNVTVNANYDKETVIIGTHPFQITDTARTEMLVRTGTVVDDGTRTEDIFVANQSGANYSDDGAVGEVGTVAGDLDLIVARADNTGEVVWYANDGTPEDGTWGAPTLIGPDGPDATVVSATDLDKDGALDVIYGDTSHQLWAEENTAGDGTAWSALQVDGDTTDDPLSLGWADFDNDGDLDLIVGTDRTGSESLTLYEDDGTPFSGAWPSNTLGSDALGNDRNYRGLAVADFDKDGLLDIAACGGDTDRLVIFRNDGTPFTGTWDSRVIASPRGCTRIAATYLDDDDYIDLVIAYNGTTSKFLALRNDVPIDGNAFDDTWGTTQSLYTFSEGTGIDLAIVDMGMNDRPDVVGLVGGTNAVYWFENDGTPFASTWNRYTIDSNPGNVSIGTNGVVRGSIEIGDINNDQNPDVVVGVWDERTVQWYEGSDTPTSTPWQRHNITDDAGSGVYQVYVADMDNDNSSNILDFYSSGSENMQDGVEEFSGWSQLDAGSSYAFSYVVSPDKDFAVDENTTFMFQIAGHEEQRVGRSDERIWGGFHTPMHVMFSVRIKRNRTYSLNDSSVTPDPQQVSINPSFGSGSVALSCYVQDDEPAKAVQGYTVSFFNETGGLVGTNTTSSTGWARYNVDIDSIGTFNYSCSIAGNASRFIYIDTSNASLRINMTDTTVPTYSNWNISVANGSNVTRNMTIYASADWEDNWNLNHTILWHDGTGAVTGYTQSLRSIVNTSNYTLNFSDATNFTTAGPINISTMTGVDEYGNTQNTTPPYIVYLFGRLNMTNATINDTDLLESESLQFTCHLTDIDSRLPVNGYPVRYSDNNTGTWGSNTTNATGQATFTRTFTQPGQYNVTCAVSDNETLYYFALPPESASFSLAVTGLSTLQIHDQSDNGEPAYVYAPIKFYANYTNSSGQPISLGAPTCDISFDINGTWTSNASMTYNATSQYWEYNRSFNQQQTVPWTTHCNSSLYQYQQQNNSINITPFPITPQAPPNGTQLDRDEVIASLEDDTQLRSRVPSDIPDGIPITFSIIRTAPNVGASTIIGTNTTNAGMVRLEFNPNATLLAGLYNWTTNNSQATNNGTWTVEIIGALNVTFTNQTLWPNAQYNKTQTLAINATLESLGPETVTTLNDTYNATINVTLTSPSLTQTTSTLAFNGTQWTHTQGISVNEELGEWNARINATASHFWSDIISRNYTIYGRMNITNNTLASSTIPVFSIATQTCAVADQDSGSAVVGAQISFYRNATLLGTNSTNATGQASYSFEATSAGNFTLTCNVTDQPGIYYYAGDEPQGQNTLTVVPYNLSQVAPSNNTIVDRDGLGPDAETIVLIVQADTSVPAGRNITFYANRTDPINGSTIVLGYNTTNATGGARLHFNPSSTLQAGNYTWWAEDVGVGMTTEKWRFINTGSLVVMYSSPTMNPNATYNQSQNVSVRINITTPGSENTSTLVSSHNLSVNSTLIKPSGTVVNLALTPNGTRWEDTYLLGAEDEVGIWNTSTDVTAKYFYKPSVNARNFTVWGLSNLIIFDEQDELGVNTYAGHDAVISANWTGLGGTPLSTDTCTLIRHDGNKTMTYGAGLWSEGTPFWIEGLALYSVQCERAYYHNVSESNNISIQSVINLTASHERRNLSTNKAQIILSVTNHQNYTEHNVSLFTVIPTGIAVSMNQTVKASSQTTEGTSNEWNWYNISAGSRVSVMLNVTGSGDWSLREVLGVSTPTKSTVIYS